MKRFVASRLAPQIFKAVRGLVAPVILVLLASIAVADSNKNQRLANEMEHAKRAYERVAGSASTDEGGAAHLRKLKNAYENKLTALEKARINSLVEYSGHEPQFIENLRSAGSSWIDIANELNIHPSVIGIELIDDRPPPFASPLPSN